MGDTQPKVSYAETMNDEGPSVTPTRDAATVVVVRTHSVALEVLLLKRTSRASFVANAHVFPGGAVDDDDELIAAGGATRLSRFAVAAVRECFEEAGILFAHRGNGRPITATERSRWRAELMTGERRFAQLLTSEDLIIDPEPLTYWSRWVTPVGSPKRFDARFFLAAEPVDQEATPDEREVTESGWFTPADALQRSQTGEMLLILPTRMTLQSISQVARLSDLVVT
jgi:8-oxo-dGTP pyrophosphatase MutT (NUDIX family)